MTRDRCPNCGSPGCIGFYSLRGVPTNSCLLVPDLTDALKFPTADIELRFCPTCSFIFNAAWQTERTTYSESYEETQGFSPTFNAFNRQLADELVARYGLTGKTVLEIGCGKGEFLSYICSRGGNRGVGYDPSFVPARREQGASDIRFVREFFSERTDEAPPDLICCKMTLEHIAETRDFVRAVRRIAEPGRTVVFFQVPDVRRILSEAAFWDIYYEHCSYFSPRSLAYLFRRNGFEVLRVTTGYDAQYLTIEARPAIQSNATAPQDTELREIETLAVGVAEFSSAVGRAAATWQRELRGAAAAGRRTVLWGSGSKAVAFLTTLGLRDEIQFVVDINPYRQERFIPGTGQRIVAPSFLAGYRPDLVIAMNPIYWREIAQELDRWGCRAELTTVNRSVSEGADGAAARTGERRARGTVTPTRVSG